MLVRFTSVVDLTVPGSRGPSFEVIFEADGAFGSLHDQICLKQHYVAQSREGVDDELLPRNSVQEVLDNVIVLLGQRLGVDRRFNTRFRENDPFVTSRWVSNK